MYPTERHLPIKRSFSATLAPSCHIETVDVRPLGRPRSDTSLVNLSGRRPSGTLPTTPRRIIVKSRSQSSFKSSSEEKASCSPIIIHAPRVEAKKAQVLPSIPVSQKQEKRAQPVLSASKPDVERPLLVEPPITQIQQEKSPPTSPISFRGQNLLRNLSTWLARQKKNILILHGPCGVGKSFIVREFAKQKQIRLKELCALNSPTSKEVSLALEQIYVSPWITQAHKPILFLDELDVIFELESEQRKRDKEQALTNPDHLKGQKKENIAQTILQFINEIPGRFVPLLCTCNEIYHPSIKLLKPHAILIRCPLLEIGDLTCLANYFISLSPSPVSPERKTACVNMCGGDARRLQILLQECFITANTILVQEESQSPDAFTYIRNMWQKDLFSVIKKPPPEEERYVFWDDEGQSESSEFLQKKGSSFNQYQLQFRTEPVKFSQTWTVQNLQFSRPQVERAEIEWDRFRNYGGYAMALCFENYPSVTAEDDRALMADLFSDCDHSYQSGFNGDENDSRYIFDYLLFRGVNLPKQRHVQLNKVNTLFFSIPYVDLSGRSWPEFGSWLRGQSITSRTDRVASGDCV